LENRDLTPSVAPYLVWAKKRAVPRFDLANSNILPCSIDDLPGARDAVDFDGSNYYGYAPLIDAIAARYGVPAARVTTAQGASGANFLVFAALLQPGDDVLVETPGYDPLLGTPRMFGVQVNRFTRSFADGYALDPDRVRHAMTPRTRLIIITSPHNPSSVIADAAALKEIGDIAESHNAHVLLDEVYLDAAAISSPAAAAQHLAARSRPDVFVSTNSLTKSYGLYGLRCGWIISSPDVAERIRRARDVVDGSGSIVAERLAALAFAHLDHLRARTAALLDTNGRLLRDFLESRRADLEWTPAGGTVVFPKLPHVEDASAFAERLFDTHHTAVVPGRFFQAPSHFRVGFGGATEPLRGGLHALGVALDELLQ
jgi:aspartate/methionine/tyrosine aminotransferase